MNAPKQIADEEIEKEIEDEFADAQLRPWSRRKQRVAAVIWASFLAACLASLFFFAFIDPVKVIDETPLRSLQPGAMTAYAIGFYFFWIVCAVAATLAAYLLETLPRVTGSNEPSNDSSNHTSNDSQRSS